MNRPALLLGAVLATVPPWGARADEPAPGLAEPFSQKLAVMAQLGFGTPIGYYGGSVEFAPVPRLVIAVGAGLGSGPYCKAADRQPESQGPICARWHRDLQVAALARYRVVTQPRNGAFSLGAGLSTGGYTWVELTTDGPAYKTMERANWLDAEASWELRHESGLSGRMFAGWAFLLNASSLGCVGWGAGASSSGHCQQAHAGDGHQLFYLGGAIGWAFL